MGSEVRAPLKYHFVGESFELEIWHTYYQHKYDLMKKNSWQKKKFSIFGRVTKLVAVKFLHVGKL